MRKCKIGIVGFGTVGSGIYKILSSKVDTHPILKEIEIVKIAVKDLNKKRDIKIDNNLLTDDPFKLINDCLLYTSPSPRDSNLSRMPSSA